MNDVTAAAFAPIIGRMDGTVAAFGASGLYYVGFALFKVAADRMAPVRGNRFLHMVATILSNWIFLIGLMLVLGGLALQIISLSLLAVSVAVPMFVSGLVPLLLISMIFFRERLMPREWLSLVLIAGAMLLIALSIGNPDPIDAGEIPLWKLAAMLGPAVVVPFALMASGDRSADGRHARPITGIAYGITSGFPVGTAELAIKGWSDADRPGLTVLETPYPYATVLAAALGFGIMIAGFQRCRVSIVATVMTISAKSYLLIMGTLLYGEPWPADTQRSALRLGAVAVMAVALLTFPRYDDRGAGGPRNQRETPRAIRS